MQDGLWVLPQHHFTQGDACPHLLPQMHKHTGSRPMQTEGEQRREVYNTSAEIHSGMLNNISAKQNTFMKRRMRWKKKRTKSAQIDFNQSVNIFLSAFPILRVQVFNATALNIV